MPGLGRSIRSSVRSRATRFALIGLFALASHALLPFVHALASGCGQSATGCSSDERASHSEDCPVCGALAHSGARAASAAPSAPAPSAAPRAPELAAVAPLAQPPRIERDPLGARAPPPSHPTA
jgi:hypothetical protein